MKLFSVAYYTFIRSIKDWKYILMIFIAPLFTIMLTGSSTDTIEAKKDVLKSRLAYYIEDRGFVGNEFRALINSEAVKDAFVIKRVSNEDEGKRLVDNGSVNSFVCIKKGISEKIQEGDKVKLEVFSSDEMSQASILMQNFAHRVNASEQILNMKSKIMVGDKLNTSSELQRDNPKKTISLVESVPIYQTSKAMNGVSKWSYLNSILFIFYGCIIGGISVIRMTKDNTKKRIETMPIGKYTLVSGILIGNTLVLLTAELLLIAATKLLLGTNWNMSTSILILVFLLYGVICTSLGSLLGTVVKNIGVCVLIILCLNIFLGNSMVTVANGLGDSVLKYINPISPHYHCFLVIVYSIYNGSQKAITSSLTTLVFMAAVTTTLAVLAGRSKKA